MTVGEVLKKAKENTKLRNLYDTWIKLSRIREDLVLLKDSFIFNDEKQDKLNEAYRLILEADIFEELEKEYNEGGVTHETLQN